MAKILVFKGIPYLAHGWRFKEDTSLWGKWYPNKNYQGRKLSFFHKVKLHHTVQSIPQSLKIKPEKLRDSHLVRLTVTRCFFVCHSREHEGKRRTHTKMVRSTLTKCKVEVTNIAVAIHYRINIWHFRLKLLKFPGFPVRQYLPGLAG